MELRSEIIDIQSMNEILPYIEMDTLVVFNVDTLITPKQMLGGNGWFHNTIFEFVDRGFSIDESRAKIQPLNMEIQNATEVVSVEQIVPELIYGLQKKGHLLIGISSRSEALACTTIEQLAFVNIHMNKNSPKCQRLGHPSSFPLNYINGILFGMSDNKDHLLLALAKDLSCEVSKILFIDDKVNSLQQMEESCGLHGISYVGFRYAACDKKLQQFDSEVAQVQLKYLGKILSNEAADLILQERSRIAR